MRMRVDRRGHYDYEFRRVALELIQSGMGVNALARQLAMPSQTVSAKSVLKVMRRMGLHCRIRAVNPWRKYSSYRGMHGGVIPNPLNRDFTAKHPYTKLGTDVTEFKVAGGKAYFAYL